MSKKKGLPAACEIHGQKLTPEESAAWVDEFMRNWIGRHELNRRETIKEDQQLLLNLQED